MEFVLGLILVVFYVTYAGISLYLAWFFPDKYKQFLGQNRNITRKLTGGFSERILKAYGLPEATSIKVDRIILIPLFLWGVLVLGLLLFQK
jgi:hypothetical protein